MDPVSIGVGMKAGLATYTALRNLGLRDQVEANDETVEELVDSHNSLVDSHNSLVEAHNALLESHNSLVDSHNSLGDAHHFVRRVAVLNAFLVIVLLLVVLV